MKKFFVLCAMVSMFVASVAGAGEYINPGKVIVPFGTSLPNRGNVVMVSTLFEVVGNVPAIADMTITNVWNNHIFATSTRKSGVPVVFQYWNNTCYPTVQIGDKVLQGQTIMRCRSSVYISGKVGLYSDSEYVTNDLTQTQEAFNSRPAEGNFDITKDF